MDKTVTDKILEQEIFKHTVHSFCLEIENLVWMKDISYLEAIVELQSEYNYEPEFVAKLLTQDMIGAIKVEQIKLSNVKKEDNSLF